MPDQREPRKGFEPAKAQWLGLIAPFFFAGSQTDELFREAGGDWTRVLHAMPFALTSCAATVGAMVLIGLIPGRPFGKWRREHVAPQLDWLWWLSAVLWLVAGLAYMARLSLAPPDRLTWNWTPITWPPENWRFDLLILALIVGFVFVVSWWLGFVERDRARAMERDRLSARRAAGGR